MRILTVANHLGARGGLERTQLTNCRALAARGHRVDLIYVSTGDFTEEWERFCGTMVQVPGTLPRRRRPLSSTLGVLAALRAARSMQPDVVYLYRYWDLPFAAVVRALTGTAVVLHLCLPPPRSVPRWLGWALRRVDAVLSVSHDTVHRWEGTALRAVEAEVVLTGIDLSHYVPAGADARARTRRGLGLPEDSLVVLYAGRIGREKGIDVLVRAFRHVVEAEPRSRLVVVGSPSLGADPADSARFQDELRRLAGDAPVTWLEARPDVVDLIQAADVAVAPSLWPEPLSRSVMEPLACAVPVVATRVGGNPEILVGWLEEYLVEPQDVAGLATRIGGVQDWRRRHPDLGDRCRREAQARLSLAAEVAAVEARLERAGADAQPRRRRRSSTSPADATSCG